MHIQELTCFGEHAGAGNPALVIQDDHSDDAARLAFARQHGKTCVFMDPSDEADVACRLDYVYPHTRSPLCIHATLAAAHVLFAQTPQAAQITVKTALHGQALVLSRHGREFFVRLAAQATPRLALASDLPQRLLAAPGMLPVSPPQLASVGSPKLLIEVTDQATLYGLQPDLDYLTRWGKANGINGCYVYCRLGEHRYEGRNFNHLDPRMEDTATGVAAGALTVALGHALTLRQGHVSGNSCLMHTVRDGNFILVGGMVES